MFECTICKGEWRTPYYHMIKVKVYNNKEIKAEKYLDKTSTDTLKLLPAGTYLICRDSESCRLRLQVAQWDVKNEKNN